MLSWEVSSSSHHKQDSTSHHKSTHHITTYHIPMNQLIIQVVAPIRQVVLSHRLHVEVQPLKPVLERLPRLHLLQRRLYLTPSPSTHIERRLARVDQHLLQFYLSVFVALCYEHIQQPPLILFRASASYALTSVLTSSSLPSTSTVCCDANAM